MAKENSFDIVSEPNMSEVLNALDQTRREVNQRYDFRGHDVTLEWNGDSATIVLKAPMGMVLDALSTVLGEKMAKRGVPLRFLEFANPIPQGMDRATQTVSLKRGIESAKAKEIQKTIKGLGLKVDTQIQGDVIRVTSKSKDDLQNIVQWLKGQDFGIELAATNYR